MDEKDQPKREWTVTQLARAAGVSVSFVRKEVAAGRIVGRKVGPGLRGLWVIPNVSARAWLDNRKEQ